MIVEEGRLCIKKFGRDAGNKAVITAIDGKGFVKIMTSSRRKERRCNLNHLEFLDEVIDVKDKEKVAKALA
ncbi:MAG: 50S ribosomal protein L14e [Candidatus Marsarchaeota archaeon]|nr:50S ribosomal protein L14e [Candidatus Marsarchaeota archaeon]